MLKRNIEPHARIHWLDEIGAVRVEWLNLFMDLDKFKSICGEAINVLKENNGKTWIADSYNSDGVFPNEIQTFIAEELVGLAKSVGITKVLTVMPKNAGLASMTTRSWNNNVKQKGEFVMESFNTLDECKEWLAQVPA